LKKYLTRNNYKRVLVSNTKINISTNQG